MMRLRRVSSMSGSSVLRYVREVCRQLDQGRSAIVVRRAAVVVMIPAALAPACMEYGMAPMYGVAMEEYDCSNGYDDDYDGLTDCDDPDCADDNELCLDCFDGIDNEGDGVADCDDPDCEADPRCSGG
jgi:hypothetical protein